VHTQLRIRPFLSTLRALILLGLQSQDRASQPICCLSQHQVRARSASVHMCGHRNLLRLEGAKAEMTAMTSATTFCQASRYA
jgi:hypothetical protein